MLTVSTRRTSLADVGLWLLLERLSSARDVRDHPLVAMVLDLLSLLVSRMFGAEHPPPVVQLLEVALIASQLQNTLVLEGARLLLTDQRRTGQADRRLGQPSVSVLVDQTEDRSRETSQNGGHGSRTRLIV